MILWWRDSVFLVIFPAQTPTASIHSFAKVPALKSPCHSDVFLISEEEPSLTCMGIVERIQTSAQRLSFSMLLRPTVCRAQTFLDKLLQNRGGGGAQYCWKVRNQKYLKKQKWVLLRTLSKALLFDFCKSANIYTTIDPLISKAKPFPSFSVIEVRLLDRISNIFSFKRTILILLRHWRMEVRVLAFLWWGPLPGSVIVEDQGQFVKRRPVMLCWTAEELHDE